MKFLRSFLVAGALLAGLPLGVVHAASDSAYPKPTAAAPEPMAGHPQDEAMSGHTLRGTPVRKRTPEDFPAESRDLFWQMDAVASGPGGALEPINFDRNNDGKISKEEREAIQGRNTWLLWGGGNEGFWGWLQEDGFGLIDFLILLDSRQRAQRFNSGGLINQPGMTANEQRNFLGLYLDKPATQAAALPKWLSDHKPQHVGPASDASPIWMTQPDNDRDDSGALTKRHDSPLKSQLEFILEKPEQDRDIPVWDDQGQPVVKNGTQEKQKLSDFIKRTEHELPKDGVDYTIYGYPSGVVGLRLFLNPDFFGSTDTADHARRRWFERVVSQKEGDYYTNPAIHDDPTLVRPFRVAMSCAFCHIGPHPLSPPANPNAPEWHNLSSIIGGQYWKPTKLFGNLVGEDNVLHHLLASQQPGTIDTSLVSTDQINNANTINAVFDVPARIARSLENPPEQQSAANLLVPSIEDGRADKNPRHTPRVLLDGSDSIGAFGALARVYINIGTFWEEWKLRHNAIIGFRHQQPFELEVVQRNSVYWQTNERYRTNYLAAFFLLKHDRLADAPASYQPQNATAPMKLRDAREADGTTPSAAAGLEKGDATKRDQRLVGRKVWLDNCAICHSSKQPEGFALAFSKDWNGAAPNSDDPATYTLPMAAEDWEKFRASPAYKDYVARLYKLVNQEAEKAPGAKGVVQLDRDDPWDTDHPFWHDNFLSTDIRVPVSLVGTNSGRAMATNGLKGQMWDNFSSDTYKTLPAVGPVHFYNPFSSTSPDSFDKTNDSFQPLGEGRGYYRPASHISLWATAPYLHNNTLGVYNDDPSIKGRLVAYQDAMHRLLWFKNRPIPNVIGADGKPLAGQSAAHPGDLRGQSSAAAHDPGFIYRLPHDAWVSFAPPFIRPIVEGVVGHLLTQILTVWAWLALAALFIAAALHGQLRHVGFLLVLVAVIAALAIGYIGVADFGSKLWWAVPLGLGAGGLFLIFVRQEKPIAMHITRIFFGVLTILTLATGWGAYCFVNGRAIVHVPFTKAEIGPLPIHVGPLPRGTPVNLLMNLDPESKALPKAVTSLAAAMIQVKKENLHDEAAWDRIAKVAGADLLAASKCKDMVLDRGHGFAENLSDEDKQALLAFLETL